ncbi:glutathione S-transferase family protein [Phreatobacter stygius]|uniref:Glutathione S-transferase family protein n=1 Tax=Phreatobacter stygius TaxID=1940610 RepID=A0A4D7BGQ7_9HYPH|nr:glutathione S-transferase family protein [Phreatobacter stygius]QCI68928.1 glutathione S-transferase family protein [Phreatobacter stygius]
MKLVIANKAYSSWSFRPWILMKALSMPFEEEVIRLYQPDTSGRISRYSQAGRVPILIDGEITVWDSLAIIEYLAETLPEAGVWPRDRAARAHARAISCEMHSGFMPLRARLPMNLRRQPKAIPHDEDVDAAIDRVCQAWIEARDRFGGAGEFLYGEFSAADAMYAPVINRFHAYAVPVPPGVKAYMEAMMALPAWKEWLDGAMAEPWFEPRYDDIA